MEAEGGIWKRSVEALIAKAKVLDGEWVDESLAPAAGGEATTEEKPKRAVKKKAPAKKAAKATEK